MHQVFHPGEIAVQERTGERALAERRGAMIGGRLVEGARAFLADQGIVAVAALGPDGGLVASLWCGDPGLLRSDEAGGRVEVVAARDRTLVVDPVRPLLRATAPLGMLVIDLESRRRLRINGTIDLVGPTVLAVGVQEVFGNCLKYIQRRRRFDVVAVQAPRHIERGTVLDAARRAFVGCTDTAFVASLHSRRGLDISHRGGHPGFIQVGEDRVLRIPDYPGNAMYQTLGNVELDPRAAIALVDFERQRVLSLTGSAEATFGVDDARYPTGGTGRGWSFTVQRWVEFPLPPTLAWTLIEPSPFNPPPVGP